MELTASNSYTGTTAITGGTLLLNGANRVSSLSALDLSGGLNTNATQTFKSLTMSANSTLDLLTTFPPNRYAPSWLVKRFAYSLMDEPLLRAFRYPVPSRAERAFFVGGMRLRARLLRLLPARSKPKWVSQYGYFRTYPAGYDIDHLGTFPPRDVEPGEAVS